MSSVISSRNKLFPYIKPIYLPIYFLILVTFGLGFLYFIDRTSNPNNLPKELSVSKGETPSLKNIADGSFLKDLSASKQDWKIVKVKGGWNLSTLAQQYYQSTDLYLLDLILEANPQITNANSLQVNDEIRIPRVTEEAFLNPSADRTYKIHLGTFKHTGFLKNFERQAVLKGKKFEVVPRKVSPEETWYRIVVGDFADKEEGLKVIRMLRAKRIMPVFSGS